MYQRLASGRPSMSGTAISPAFSSRPIVCSDRKRDAHAGHHRLLDRLVARHLHRHARRQPVVGEELLHRRPRTRAFLADQELVVGERGRRRVTGFHQRVVRGRHDHMRMHGERLGPGRQLARWAAHDRQVDFVGLQQRDQLLAVAANRQPHLDSRMFSAEASH